MPNFIHRALKESPEADAAFRARLKLQGLLGAGAWLTAFPVDDARTFDPELFKVSAKRRVRMRVQAKQVKSLLP